MNVAQCCTFAVMFWLLNSFNGRLFGQNVAPANIQSTIETNSCATIVRLKWIQPNSSWEVKNYVIAFWITQYSNPNITTKAQAEVITRDNRTEENITVSDSYVIAYFKIAANFSHGNQNYSIGPWSNTTAVAIFTTNCSSAKTGNGSERGVMYVVVLVGIIFGSCVGLMIVLYAVVRIYVWKKEKRYDKNDLSLNEKRGRHLVPIDHGLPVSTDKFCDHVSSMKSKFNQGFCSEWEKLAEASNQKFAFGNRPFNAAKNRYANMPTFDWTRVILQQKQGKEESTYINANYVDDIERPKAYIATQAPLPETVSDFWRMVWEQEVRHIVMIASLREKDNTACKYWPSEGECEYGKVAVKIMDSIKHADYTIRWFKIRNHRDVEPRLIQHFQYHSWPAKSCVPVHPTAFLDFVKTVSSFETNNMKPVVVHCFSGNGRTGVFIVVDSQLKRIERQRNVNIFFNVDTIRHQRHKIIRTMEEYIFIHECILDHLTSMNGIDVVPRYLADFIREKKEVNDDGSTGLQKEFTEVLHDPTSMHNRCDAARLPQNRSKNHFENILPYDHTRVKLSNSNLATSHRNDYINANYCSSMRRQRNYIITQNPMECTLFDFWFMVWENSSLTIVMLSYQEEGTVSYWPEESEVLKAGKIQIRCILYETLKDYDIRQLEISHDENDASKLIRQYQYKSSIDNSNKDSVKSYVDFIVQCNTWHVASKCRTIVVHCRAGTGRSGTFVALSQLIDRLDATHAINIFKTVKRLRQNRMAVIQTLSQYELLYQAMECYYRTYYLKKHEIQDGEDDSTQPSLTLSIST